MAESESRTPTDRLIDLIRQLSQKDQVSLLNQIEKYVEGKKTEKRAYERIKCFLPLNYINLLEMVTDYANDISPEGVFMQTDADLTIGDEIFLRINFSETSNPFQIPAEVVRTTHRGVGLRFNFKSQVQRAIIESLINSLKEIKQGIESTRLEK